MDQSNRSLLDRIERGFDRANDRVDRSDERHGRDMRWVIGLLVTNTVAIVGVAIRLIAA
jgi:hypothetical protein